MGGIAQIIASLANQSQPQGPMSGETLGLPSKPLDPRQVQLDPEMQQMIEAIYGGQQQPGQPQGPQGGGGFMDKLVNALPHTVPGAAEQHMMEIQSRQQMAQQIEKARLLSELIRQKHYDAIAQHQQQLEMAAGQREAEAERQHQANESQKAEDAKRKDTEFQTRMDMLGKQLEANQAKSEQQQKQFEAKMDQAERRNQSSQSLAERRLALQERNANKPEKPTQMEENRADLSKNLKENVDDLEDVLSRRPELFGPAAGKLTKLKSIIGTHDPDVARLNQIKENLGLVVQSSHGMRAYRGVEAAAQSILNNFNNSSEAMKAAIDQSRKSASTFEADVAAKKGQTVEEYEAPYLKSRGKTPKGKSGVAPGVTHIWTPNGGLQPVQPNQPNQ